jgi:hypothetical protein
MAGLQPALTGLAPNWDLHVEMAAKVGASRLPLRDLWPEVDRAALKRAIIQDLRDAAGMLALESGVVVEPESER